MGKNHLIALGGRYSSRRRNRCMFLFYKPEHGVFPRSHRYHRTGDDLCCRQVLEHTPSPSSVPLGSDAFSADKTEAEMCPKIHLLKTVREHSSSPTIPRSCMCLNTISFPGGVVKYFYGRDL